MATPSGRWVIGYPVFVIYSLDKWDINEFKAQLENHNATDTYNFYYDPGIDEDPPSIPRGFYTWGFCSPKGHNPIRVDIKENYNNKYINIPLSDEDIVINLGQAKTDIVLNWIFTKEEHYNWFRSVMQTQYDYIGRNAMTTKNPEVIPLLLFPGTSAEYRLVYVDNWKTIRSGERGGVWEVQVTLVDLEPHQYLSNPKPIEFGVNELYNGRFEGDNPTRRWYNQGLDEFTAVIDRREGEFALKISDAGTGAYCYAEVTLSANATYVVGGWVKSSTADVRFVFVSQSTTIISDIVSAPTTWTLVFTTVIATQATCRIELAAGDTNYAKFDALFVIRATGIVSQPIEAIRLTNSGGVYTYPRSITLYGKSGYVIENFQSNGTSFVPIPSYPDEGTTVTDITNLSEDLRIDITSRTGKLGEFVFNFERRLVKGAGTAKIYFAVHDDSNNVLTSMSSGVVDGFAVFTANVVAPKKTHIHLLNLQGTKFLTCDTSVRTLYKYDSRGTLLISFTGDNTNNINVHGATWDGYYWWVVDANADMVYKLDMNGIPVLSFSTPVSATLTKGITWDGKYIWLCDASTLKIYRVNPTDGTVNREFAAPGTNPSGLAHDGSSLWVCDQNTEMIYKLNAFGSVLLQFSTPAGASAPVGLAWDGSNLWVADDTTSKAYKLDANGTALLSISIATNDGCLAVVDDVVAKSARRDEFNTIWFEQYYIDGTRNFKIYNKREPSNVLNFGREFPEQSQPYSDRFVIMKYPTTETVKQNYMAQKITLKQGNVTKIKLKARKNGVVPGFVMYLYPEVTSVFNENIMTAGGFKAAVGTGYLPAGMISNTAANVYFVFDPPVQVGTATVSYFMVIIPSDNTRSNNDYIEWAILASGAIYSGGNLYDRFAGKYFYVVSYSNAVIYKVREFGVDLTQIPAPCNFPWGVTWDGTNLYITDDSTAFIFVADEAGNLISSITAPATMRGIDYDSNTNTLWCVSAITDTVYNLGMAGTVITQFSIPPSGGAPAGLTYDGTIWVYDYASGVLHRLTDDGTRITSISLSIELNRSIQGIVKDNDIIWAIEFKTTNDMNTLLALGEGGTLLLEFTLPDSMSSLRGIELRDTGIQSRPSACLTYTTFYEDPISVTLNEGDKITVLTDGNGFAEWQLVASGDAVVNIGNVFDSTNVVHTATRWEFNSSNNYIIWKLETPFPMKNLRITEIKASMATAVDSMKFFWSKDLTNWTVFKIFATNAEFDTTADYKFGSGTDNLNRVFLKAMCTTGASLNYIKRLKVRCELDTTEYSPIEIEVGTAELITEFDPSSPQKAKLELTYRERR